MPNFFFLGLLATHILTHTFQHTPFDWLKFTWDLSNHVGPIYIWWSYVNINQPKRLY